MKIQQIIDLSHPLRPGKEGRRLDIERLEATNITGAPGEQDWYIMHYIRMDNHLGTHLEVPYHVFPDGKDIATMSVEQFCGEAILLDLRGYQSLESIPLEAVQKAASDAGGIQSGDIVLLMTGWSQYYGTPEYFKPPFITQEALRWLMGQGVKALGIDTTGAMNPENPDRSNHLPIFEAGAFYIENLTNLERIPASRVWITALPPAIHGLEGFPVRVVAFVE